MAGSFGRTIHHGPGAGQSAAVCEQNREASQPQTRRHALNLLRRCLADALEHDPIATNPATGIKLRGDAEPREIAFLSPAEIAGVIDLAGHAVVDTGCADHGDFRRAEAGELLALRWESVELTARHHIVVRRSNDGPTKSGKVRRVPLLAPHATRCFRGGQPAEPQRPMRPYGPAIAAGSFTRAMTSVGRIA